MTGRGTPLDSELARITARDQEYASELLFDISGEAFVGEKLRIVSQWLCKVRYEAVIADRKRCAADQPPTIDPEEQR